MNISLVLALIVLFAISVPVGISIILASVFGIHFFSSLPLLVVPQKMFASLDSFPLLAIPFFILAGNLMSSGGVSRRLVDFARAVTGNLQGGLASSCVVTCMIFAAISGSSVATTFAIGAILIPAMVRAGYPVQVAASIQASSAELGVIIPPSVPMILYAVATETSITQLFIAGLGPGLLIAGMLIAMIMIWSRIKGYGLEEPPSGTSISKAVRKAIWALLLPVIVIGGIYGGIFTPTEAAAVSAVYALIISLFVYRELALSDLPRIFRVSAMASGVVMLIIAAAGLFSFLVALSGLPNLISDWAQTSLPNKFAFLALVNLLLLVVGMFVETSAAILVLGPILAPVAMTFGIDPVHFGVIMVVNLALGMITPPLGVNLFAAATVAKVPVERLFPALIFPVSTILIALALISYIPAISLFLRDLLLP